MSEIIDRPNVVIHPPIALAIAFVAGLVVDWLYPLPFVPTSVPRVWVGTVVFLVGLLLVIWAMVTFRRAGTRVETSKATTTIVANGPYRFTRNPIYIGMFLGLTGLAIAFDNLWMLVALVAFYFVIRYGVIAREEAYLERKFSAAYLDYKSRVRRWV